MFVGVCQYVTVSLLSVCLYFGHFFYACVHGCVRVLMRACVCVRERERRVVCVCAVLSFVPIGARLFVFRVWFCVYGFVLVYRCLSLCVGVLTMRVSIYTGLGFCRFFFACVNFCLHLWLCGCGCVRVYVCVCVRVCVCVLLSVCMCSCGCGCFCLYV